MSIKYRSHVSYRSHITYRGEFLGVVNPVTGQRYHNPHVTARPWVSPATSARTFAPAVTAQTESALTAARTFEPSTAARSETDTLVAAASFAPAVSAEAFIGHDIAACSYSRPSMLAIASADPALTARPAITPTTTAQTGALRENLQ